MYDRRDRVGSIYHEISSAGDVLRVNDTSDEDALDFLPFRCLTEAECWLPPVLGVSSGCA